MVMRVSSIETCHVVGSDMIAVVLDFFTHGKLLNEIYFIVITLIHKVACPRNVSEFRSISYCNVIYKCIAKLICNIMREVLPEIIMETQGPLFTIDTLHIT